eukprot:TRINITY_DN38738_c0_g1_i1.p1 TRINITY_DN38738_c0_g1~~TRINITY_DN38738_c0_g1_i1.p1  ORF type:complete len:278 (-),score=55.08 TRINITY_DN38738_c0_g1_i1:20-853(-)
MRTAVLGASTSQRLASYSAAGPIAVLLAARRLPLQQLGIEVITIVLNFAYTPLGLLPKVIGLSPERLGSSEAKLSDPDAVELVGRSILRMMRDLGSSSLPAGLHFELRDLHRFRPAGDSDGTAACNAASQSNVFAHASVATFQRHMLVECHERQSKEAWEPASVQFWCTTCLRSAEGQYSCQAKKKEQDQQRFAARVILCRVQVGREKLLVDHAPPSLAHEFEAIFEGTSHLRLAGFNPGSVLKQACAEAADDMPGRFSQFIFRPKGYLFATLQDLF